MKTPILLSLTLAAALPLAAQTPAPVHHTATAGVHHTGGGCVTLPEFSSKIPALPAGLSCAKPLYTLTRTPDVKLDYAAPFISPEVRLALAPPAGTYSLVYIDTKVGTGDLIQPKKWLTVHYTGYLPDGTKFDSSLDRGEPISFPYGQHRVIPGWDTGFEGMHIGGKRRLFIPYELAYGEAGHPPVIPAKSELIFDVEFIAQSDEQPKPKTPPTPPAPPAKPLTTTPPPAPAAKPATPPAGTTATPPPNKQ
jgi:peptidylprolyl isomerase